MKEEKVKFKRRIGKKGLSTGVNIPIELLEFLDLQDGDYVHMCGEIGQHGRFMSIWKEDIGEVRKEIEKWPGQ